MSVSHNDQIGNQEKNTDNFGSKVCHMGPKGIMTT